MSQMQQETRERILSTAVELFTRYGYDAVGVQGLCSAAGVTKPTLYHWFGNKYGVLEAAVQQYGDRFLQRLEVPFSYNGDVPLTLQAIAAALLELAERQPRAMRLLLSLQHAPQASESSRAADGFFRELHRRMQTVFAAASQDHGNMRGRDRAYAVSYLAVVLGYAELAMDGELPSHSDNLAFRIMHQFSHGIYS